MRKMRVESMVNRHNNWTAIARVRSANECARASSKLPSKKILDYEEPDWSPRKAIIWGCLIGAPIIGLSFLAHGVIRYFGIWLGLSIPMAIGIGKWLKNKQ